MNLAGRSVFVVGRLPGLTRARLAWLLGRAGATLSTSLGLADMLCLANGSAGRLLRQDRLALPPKTPAPCAVVSELTLRRALGLAGPAPEEHRSIGAPDLARQARLDEPVVEALSVYDVLQPVDGLFGYRDLVAAREVARLLATGLRLVAIVTAAHELRRSGRGLSDTRLQEAPWGELLQQAAGRMARLHGQYELPLGDDHPDIDALFDEAERLEAMDDMPGAERIYRRLLDLDRADAVLPFNLGNVLYAQGRRHQAAHAYLQAVSRDPAFADGWVNLGVLRKEADPVSAERCYDHALASEPDHATALLNLALLLTERGAEDRAIPYWERFIATRPEPRELSRAKRLVGLCRMAVGADR